MIHTTSPTPFTAFPNPLLVLDASGVPVDINKAAASLLRRHPDLPDCLKRLVKTMDDGAMTMRIEQSRLWEIEQGQAEVWMTRMLDG